MFAETYGTNTVFENPTQFHLCSIEFEKLSKLRGKGRPKRCYNCGNEGHLSTECPKPKGKSCYNCGNEGHLIAECPKPKDKRSTNAISSSGASSPRKDALFSCERKDHKGPPSSQAVLDDNR